MRLDATQNAHFLINAHIFLSGVEEFKFSRFFKVLRRWQKHCDSAWSPSPPPVSVSRPSPAAPLPGNSAAGRYRARSPPRSLCRQPQRGPRRNTPPSPSQTLTKGVSFLDSRTAGVRKMNTPPSPPGNCHLIETVNKELGNIVASHRVMTPVRTSRAKMRLLHGGICVGIAMRYIKSGTKCAKLITEFSSKICDFEGEIEHETLFSCETSKMSRRHIHHLNL